MSKLHELVSIPGKKGTYCPTCSSPLHQFPGTRNPRCYKEDHSFSLPYYANIFNLNFYTNKYDIITTPNEAFEKVKVSIYDNASDEYDYGLKVQEFTLDFEFINRDSFKEFRNLIDTYLLFI
jgi:hypothetical protein